METFDVIMTCCEAPDRVVHALKYLTKRNISNALSKNIL